MTHIYLDNSATTRPYSAVTSLAGRIMDEIDGNPSSMHEMGIAAERAINTARCQIAALFNAREEEIVFTSGGTEANNLAIVGTARQNRKQGNHIVTSLIEHPSVLNCFKHLESNGFRVSYLPVNQHGYLDPDRLKKAVTEETILVSIMHINNETGTIEPLAELGRAVKEKNRQTLFHIDAVQSYAKLPIQATKWQADLISCSAHKIHGPRGAGALWIKEGLVIEPLFHGGGQENNYRPGTENTAAIAGFGLSAKINLENMAVSSKNLMELKLIFLRELRRNNPGFLVNGPAPEQGAPHIINLSFPGLKAETILHSLENRGVYVSSGSACHSRHPEQSHVLKALGISSNLIDSALRFSFSGMNTREEVLQAAALTAETINELKRLFA